MSALHEKIMPIPELNIAQLKWILLNNWIVLSNI
jgi:hypothetical protein